MTWNVSLGALIPPWLLALARQLRGRSQVGERRPALPADEKLCPTSAEFITFVGFITLERLWLGPYHYHFPSQKQCL